MRFQVMRFQVMRFQVTVGNVEVGWIMRAVAIARLCAVLVMTSGTLAFAQTAQKPGSVTGTGIAKKLPPGTLSKLTKQECEGLGGKVSDDNMCKGGSKCITTNQDGVQHEACIDNAKN